MTGPLTISMGIPTWTEGIGWLLRVELKTKERISPALDWKRTFDSSCPSRWPWGEQEMTCFFSARFWNWLKLKGKREETLSPRVLTNDLTSPPRPMFKTVDDIRVWTHKSFWQSQNPSQILIGYPINRCKSHIIDISGIFWLYATVVTL